MNIFWWNSLKNCVPAWWPQPSWILINLVSTVRFWLPGNENGKLCVKTLMYGSNFFKYFQKNLGNFGRNYSVIKWRFWNTKMNLFTILGKFCLLLFGNSIFMYVWRRHLGTQWRHHLVVDLFIKNHNQIFFYISSAVQSRPVKNE